jgi:hypothetical protein
MGHKHNKSRCFTVTCKTCGVQFTTGSSIKKFCSKECRVISVATQFTPGDECWNWPLSINPKTGYGQMSEWVDGKRMLYTSHRVSYTAHKGEISLGLSVLHRCDNRKCFNPAHLFLGTQLDNMRDAACKGRLPGPPKNTVNWQHLHPEKIVRGKDHHLSKDSSCLPRGSEHHATKITEVEVLEIRKSSSTLRELSEIYGMSQSALGKIRAGQSWRHV